MISFLMFIEVLLGASTSTSVTFNAGSANQSFSSLVANINVVTADGLSTTTLTFLGRDITNNPVGGLAVSFAASGSANTFGAISGTTNSMGVLTTSLASSLAQNETIVASYGNGQNSNTIVQFVPGPVSNVTSSLILNPNSQIANNSNSIAATVTILDAHANPISGVSVTFQSSAAAVPSPSSATTNASGNAFTSYHGFKYQAQLLV